MYSGIQTLPLKKYIDYIADGNIYGLVINGTAEPEVLQKKWDEIVNLASAMNATADYKMYLHVFKKLTAMEIEFAQIHWLAGGKKIDPETKEITQGFLRTVYNEDLIKELNKLLRTNTFFNWADQKSYQDALDRCIRRSAVLKIQIDLKKMQYDAIKKKFTDKAEAEQGKKGDDAREHYMGMLIELTEFAGVTVTDNITVWEYYRWIHKYNKYYQSLPNGRKKLVRK